MRQQYEKYKNSSYAIAKIIENKCPSIHALLVLIEKNLRDEEKIEIIHWTDTYLHVWVDDHRFLGLGIYKVGLQSVNAMRMGFSVDYENDVIFYAQPYTTGNGFYSRSTRWNKFLKKNNIDFDQYTLVEI